MDCCPLPADWTPLEPNTQIRNSVKVVFWPTPDKIKEMAQKNALYEFGRSQYRIAYPHIMRQALLEMEEKQRVEEKSMSTGDQPETPPSTPL